ncbi:MAG TPA: BON domain-containing protein [Longimicrobiales bacterium]
MREAWEGRRRTRIEDRVLDAIWADRVLGRRAIDAQEVEEGRVVLLGQIRSEEERERARAIVGRVNGVNAVEDRLEIVPPRARPVRGLRRSRPQAGEPQVRAR